MIKSIFTLAFFAMFGSYFAVNMNWMEDYTKKPFNAELQAEESQPKVDKKLSFTERVTQKQHRVNKL